jgi:hypothetical protein
MRVSPKTAIIILLIGVIFTWIPIIMQALPPFNPYVFIYIIGFWLLGFIVGVELER